MAKQHLVAASLRCRQGWGAPAAVTACSQRWRGKSDNAMTLGGQEIRLESHRSYPRPGGVPMGGLSAGLVFFVSTHERARRRCDSDSSLTLRPTGSSERVATMAVPCSLIEPCSAADVWTWTDRYRHSRGNFTGAGTA